MSAETKAVIEKTLKAMVDAARAGGVPVAEYGEEPCIEDGNFHAPLRPLAEAAALAAVTAFLANTPTGVANEE